MSKTKLHELFEEFGQSIWLDNINRELLISGQLEDLVDKGVRGLTSNPSIFQKAIQDGAVYDEQISKLPGKTTEEVYWALSKQDIRDALAVLRPVFDESNGTDGFASIEVDPRLAHDTQATIDQAKDLHADINQPNLMVKVPATEAGIPAIKQLIGDGHSINVTLIFGLERYRQVIEAYLSGLESHDGDLSKIASVASFFVSRVDSMVDETIESLPDHAGDDVLGKVAIAQANAAYQIFQEVFGSERWQKLAERGARVQRPLWASTSTKNPHYHDTLYVNSLIGRDTVNTVPDETLEFFFDHGHPHFSITKNSQQRMESVLKEVDALGIDMSQVSTDLEAQGVDKFIQAFKELLESLEQRLAS